MTLLSPRTHNRPFAFDTITSGVAYSFDSTGSSISACCNPYSSLPKAGYSE